MEIQDFKSTMNTISHSDKAHKEPPSASEIQAWMVSYVAQLLEVEPDEIDVTLAFDQYGLDSAAAVGMTGDMEDWLGTRLDPTLLYDYPTIEALARHLAEEFRLVTV
jgi:acyl carrier protein